MSRSPIGEPVVESPLKEKSEAPPRGDTSAAPAFAATVPPEAARPVPTALHIPSLDGLRAVSFLIVFVSHAGLSGIVPGYFGLSVFFFLSGYLITTLLRLEFDRAGDISFTQFYLRRALRIFPPFYVVLGVAYFLTVIGFLGGSLWTSAVLAQCFHFTNYYVIRHGWWDGIAPGTWVYWSLAVEEHFYFFFPLFYLWLRRRSSSGTRQAFALLSVCALVLAWRCVLVFLLHASKERTYMASDTRVDSILAGCVLAVWHNPVLDRDAFDEKRFARLWLPLGVISVLVSFTVRVDSFEQTLRYTLQSFGLLPIFIAAIRWHDRWPFRILNWGWVRYAGMLSYSMYLMHTSVIWIFHEHTRWHPVLRGVVTLLIVVLLGALIYQYIEKPCAKIRRDVARYLDVRAGKAQQKPMAA